MTGPRRPAVRRILACGFAAAALLLGGCVYLRLLELKNQLGDFDRHFALESGDGLTLVCRTPVLRAADVRWIGLRPETTRRVAGREQWQVRWVKDLPAGVTEEGTYDLALALGFADDRLARVEIPERYFALMPKDFVAGVIRSVGRGRVSKLGRQLDTSVSESDIAAARPRLPAIGKLLGVPSEERTAGTETMSRYRYRPVTTEAGAAHFELTLHFDTASGDLLRWHGRTPVGNLSFDFSADRAAVPKR